MTNNDYTPIRPADFDYDAALADLRERIRRKRKVQSLLAHFGEEAARLTSVMEDRKADYDAEQADVEALQGKSITLFVYTLMGLKEEKIQKEEAEAISARFEYEVAKADLDYVLNRQVELRAELRTLGNCERAYEDMVAEKKAWLMAKEATINAEVEALEAEKTAIIRDSKELKEAMESGRYALKVAESVEDALHTLYTFQSEVFRENRHNSIYRDHDLSLEIRNSRIRVENSLETLGRYLQDFAAELKDLIGQPEEVLPTARIEEVLTWISQWVKNVTTKHHGGSHGVSPILGELTPLVCDLEQKYAAKETLCRELDDKIREIVIGQ